MGFRRTLNRKIARGLTFSSPKENGWIQSKECAEWAFGQAMRRVSQRLLRDIKKMKRKERRSGLAQR